MPKPIRVQRKRSRGWKMPPNTVYVGRPSKWGNIIEFDRDDLEQMEIALQAYLYWVKWMISIDELNLNELKGKNLACWCKPGDPCHADVLLAMANGRERDGMG